jgi:hypothetical protein
MSSSTHRTDEQWVKIIDDLLGDARKEREAARSVVWSEVLHFVVHSARLEIGPLREDEEVRRDIGVRVLKKLESNDYAHLREWRARQLRKRDHASWWGFIKLVTRHRAIEYVRTCSLNVARRGDPFKWVRVEVADPVIFDESLDASMEFLMHCTEPALYDYLDRFQSAHWPTSPEPPSPPPALPRSPLRPRRDRR